MDRKMLMIYIYILYIYIINIFSVHYRTSGLVGCGCRIHRLQLCRGVRSPNESPGMIQNNSKVRLL